MAKKFLFEQASSPEKDYKTKILAVINDLERRIRVVHPEENKFLYDKLHEKRMFDARREEVEFVPVRADICETFAVSEDPEHIFMFDAHRGNPEPSVKQRTIRCFCVIFDVLKHEGYYGEGRITHNFLLNKLVELVEAANEGLKEDEVYLGMENNPPRFIFVKGFMSTTGFKELPERDRRDQEHPLLDETGQPIKTAEGWFVSGNNLEDTKGIRGESKLVS